jgi:hypothetical protein
MVKDGTEEMIEELLEWHWDPRIPWFQHGLLQRKQEHEEVLLRS